MRIKYNYSNGESSTEDIASDENVVGELFKLYAKAEMEHNNMHLNIDLKHGTREPGKIVSIELLF